MAKDNKQLALDDTQRVKVLSPGMLVFKRFIRSKLATAGSYILIFMFLLTFLGGMLSPYGQSEIFYKYSMMESEYAMASIRTEYTNILLTEDTVYYKVSAMMNTYISSFEENQTELSFKDEQGTEYLLLKQGESIYILNRVDYSDIATYSRLSLVFSFEDESYNNDEFKNDFLEVIPQNPTLFTPTSFEHQGEIFAVGRSGANYTVKRKETPKEVLLSTNLVFDSYIENEVISKDFRLAVLKSLYSTHLFSFNDKSYEIEEYEDKDNFYTIFDITGGQRVRYANVSQFVVRRTDGMDTLQLDFKLALQSFIAGMEEEGLTQAEFTYLVYDEELFAQDDNINDLDDENDEDELEEEIIGEAEGDGVQPLDNGEPTVISETTFRIERRLNSYIVKTQLERYLIDIYAPPSAKNWLGTDSNGMDVLTRIMHGGRISLIIGFIVIFIELIIGVILGGMAGYFGKWVDQLIMRLVDIFNCIPFLPVLIILGTVFDKVQMDPYNRIMWLMIILGILGWPGVARLVRGQILSLREQEFMIAAEATGLSAKRRIFRHLVPNVMPQLIVTATMGLGSIIITESTLSFLGLGAKYPLATWGAMINSVSDASSLVNYTYIWIPVGLLICLTVIAFNFVGDGLRDAFDPKMKK